MEREKERKEIWMRDGVGIWILECGVNVERGKGKEMVEKRGEKGVNGREREEGLRSE